MIPKRIFYVWGVDDPKKRDVLACMQSWRQNCPDYEIVEINEDSKKYFDFQKELKTNRWFKTVYDRKMWAYVADYVRIKTLYDNGGIYLDTDVSVVKTFDKFLNDPAFVGMQDDSHVEPAILGAQKGNKFLKYVLDIYTQKIWELPIYTMPELFDWAFRNLYKEEFCQFGDRNNQKTVRYQDINIYPEGVFIPFRGTEKFTPECITPKTHTIHWWNASWVKPSILHFLKNKHLLSLEKLDALPLNKVELRILNIPFLKLKIYEEKVTLGSLLLLKKVALSKTKGKYVENFCWKLFGIIPMWTVMKTKLSNKHKYILFNVICFKVK